MDSLKSFLKTHQQTLVLGIGYILVAALGYGLGNFTAPKVQAPEIRVEQAFTPTNYSANASTVQSNPQVSGSNTAATPTGSLTANCAGKIKGSSSMIYHIPGGAFYDKTTKPIRCFDTEADAVAAGFRKSSK